MMLPAKCPACGRTGRVPEESQGKKVKCPRCGEKYVVETNTRTEGETWYYQELGAVKGPVSFATLQHLSAQDEIGPETLVRRNQDGWELAYKVTGLVFKVLKQPNPKEETIPETSKATTNPPRSSQLRVVVGFGVVVVLLLAFGLTVGLVVYFCVKSTEQEPTSSLSEGNSNEFSSSRAESEGPAPMPAEGPSEVLPKTLAKMDRLTIEIAPQQADESPTPDIWTGHTATIRGVAFTDDGRFVVSVSGALQTSDRQIEDNSIRVWDARRGKQLRKLDGFREALDAVSVSPGGRFAIFGHGGHYEGEKWVDSINHGVHLWDIQDNKEFYIRKSMDNADTSEARFIGLNSSVDSTAFSPDRKRVAGTDNSGQLVVWKADTGDVLFRKKVEAVARLRTDENSGAQVRFTLSGTNCVFTPDSRYLLVGGADYTVRLFDATTGQQLHTFESHEDIVWAVAAKRTRDGRLLGLSGGGNRQALRRSGFVPGSRDYAIRLWNLETHQEVHRFKGHEEAVLSLTFCPNGRHFLSAGVDKTVRLWDIASGKLLRTYRGHTSSIRSVSVSPDGRAAVSGGNDCTIRYWRLPTTVDDLIVALEKSHVELRAAMRDLDTMGPELRAAFPKLVQILCQNDKPMGELAMTILRRLGQPDKEWVNGLSELLNASLPEARLFAVKALAQLGSDALPAANDLGQVMERETDEEIKTEAIHTLGKIGGKSQLRKMFHEAQEANLIVAVLDALGVAEGLDRSLIDQLLTTKGLQHADPTLRSKALASLRRLGLDTLRIMTLAEVTVQPTGRSEGAGRP